MAIRKNDNVFILSGKDKGKKGKVLRVLNKLSRAVVEGVNVIKKHQKPTQNFKGGIIEKSAPLAMSKLMLICQNCSKPARFAVKEGKRICKKCGEVVDKK